MLVTDDGLLGERDPVAVCQAAVRGGVTSVQLRLKHASPRELLALLRRLLPVLDVPVLVNDRLDVALAGGAAGVHLGPDDVPVGLARSIAPAGFLVGASVGLVSEVPFGMGADYWGIGPFRATATKSDAGSALGVDGLRAVLGHLPPGTVGMAIGGVRPEDVAPILEAGAAGVAVVSGILGDGEIEERARSYAERLPAGG